MTATPSEGQRMEKIVSLCKRRGFIFQSSEIYGGLNGAWDYGPLGVELKRNLKNYWWRVMVHERDDVVGMDGSILMNRAVWKASGHENTFTDPMVDCLLTGKRFRADQIEPQSGLVFSYSGAIDLSRFEEAFDRATYNRATNVKREIRQNKNRICSMISDWNVSADPNYKQIATDVLAEIGKDKRIICEQGFSLLLPRGKPPESARKVAVQFYRQRGVEQPELQEEKQEQLKNTRRYNPENGSLLTEPRSFNLMFKTYVGATEDESALTYLRPETAQSIFVQFKNILEVSRKKLPFGIAQIGKAFRNEINPRNFTFRSREFEQMELEYFCREKEGMKWLDYWLEQRLKFYENIGIPRARLHAREVPDDERAFYSKGTYDIEYDFPFGRQELEGVAYRTNYDLSQHQNASGKSLEYFDDETKQRFIPHVVEPSAGVDRTILALICDAYAEDEAPNDKGEMESRIVLRFHPRIAPIKCAVFPLLKNKEPLVAKAKEIVALLRPQMTVFYDESGAIGRRYRRQDEIGTPFGITVDFETLGEKDPTLRDTVTLRDRDSMKQERVKIQDLPAILRERIS
jgi:glycyl-tRNA synthetase